MNVHLQIICSVPLKIALQIMPVVHVCPFPVVLGSDEKASDTNGIIIVRKKRQCTEILGAGDIYLLCFLEIKTYRLSSGLLKVFAHVCLFVCIVSKISREPLNRF